MWKWQPAPVFLPGESHGQRSLASPSPWDHKESDTTERLTLHSWGGRCGVPGKPKLVKGGLKGQKDPGLFGSPWVLLGEPLGPTLSNGGLEPWSPTFVVPGSHFKGDSFFPWTGDGGWFGDNSSALHLLCTLFLLLLHQLRFRSSASDPRGWGLLS